MAFQYLPPGNSFPESFLSAQNWSHLFELKAYINIENIKFHMAWITLRRNGTSQFRLVRLFVCCSPPEVGENLAHRLQAPEMKIKNINVPRHYGSPQPLLGAQLTSPLPSPSNIVNLPGQLCHPSNAVQSPNKVHW